MKEECKLCSVNGWCGNGTTDFSINSLMRPAAHPEQMEPRHEAVLLSAYLFKLGYYQPAGPLIKESSAEAERALARYHPPPHYHAPPVLQQYGPYYPAELCYGRYYRPPGPYHMPSQPEAQMVGVASEPYPPPQYYGPSPCYPHSQQRIPYVEYRGCPCPLNACPKNVLIGPATGKGPAGGGPADVPSALVPPGAAFRQKVRAAIDCAADTHGSGKDPPLEPEPPEPPTAADAPHACPLPAIGGASPKREIYDVRDNPRLNADVPGPTEAIGPPSPAKVVCAPQPPPPAPRRARLGKDMARRSLVGDDTSLLISTPQKMTDTHNDADDDVLAISPPTCAPIDLSSSDERSTPLVDVKKENEGPPYATSRKTDAPALREQNCTGALLQAADVVDAAKAVKRRYSKPKLEIEMKDVQLEDACKTNGIGEHVKLQKRRKVSGELSHTPRIETITKEPKKKPSQSKRTTKTSTRSQQTQQTDKKGHKRKSSTVIEEPQAKNMLLDTIVNDDPRLLNVAAVSEDAICIKPKTKSALLLDNLIKKNSVDRPDAKGYSPDTKLNPAELFLSPSDNLSQNSAKKTLNINNNIVDNNVPVNGVRSKTIAAVSQHIEKKLAYKNARKVEQVDSKVTHGLKSVRVPATEGSNDKVDIKRGVLLNGEKNIDKFRANVYVESDKTKYADIKEKWEFKDTKKAKNIESNIMSNDKFTKSNLKLFSNGVDSPTETLHGNNFNESQHTDGAPSPDPTNPSACDRVADGAPPKRCKLGADKGNGEFKAKHVEKLVKLLASKRQVSKSSDPEATIDEETDTDSIGEPGGGETAKRLTSIGERASGERCKTIERVGRPLASGRSAGEADEAAVGGGDARSAVVPAARGARGRRGGRRARRPAAPPAAPDSRPRAAPRWSNGWSWDGEHYLSKVYLNNDPRCDVWARCWARMVHGCGDGVSRGDCVLLRASAARAQPFVARVASLWENPDDGEMMVSLVWYYRPEHTERGRQGSDAPDEVFASRHRDANSVACIEDKCYVLTFNEYCRYKKRLKAAEEGIRVGPSLVPPLPASETSAALAPNDTKLPPCVSPELVLFCRKIYDFRSKKIHVPNK